MISRLLNKQVATLGSFRSSCSLSMALRYFICRRKFFQQKQESVFKKILGLTVNKKYQFSQHSDKRLSNIQALDKTLEQISLRKTKSVLIDDNQQKQKKFLTKYEKQKLKLYVPKVPFNVRMGIAKQQEFRQEICQNLYQMQKKQLTTGVRILERYGQGQHFTMDRYINVIYKDIYARYLVSKGVGVSWQGQYSNFGVMNPNQLPPSPENLVKKFLNDNCQYLEKTTTIGPYSYRERKYIPTDLIDVQNIRKMGYFFKLSISNYGKHESSFKILQQKGDTLYLLIFSEYIQKLINPHAICLIPNKKMVILKKQINNKNNQIQQDFRYEYLITSMDLYAANKQYFNTQKYEKHSLFQSNHLLGMKAHFQNTILGKKDIINQQKNTKSQIQLQIVSELQQYQRGGGLYLVNGSTNIQDYERVTQSKLDNLQLKNIGDQNGVIHHFQGTKLSMNDLDLEPKLLGQLKKYVNFVQFYNYFADQIYFNGKTQEALKFRLYDKYQISIPQQSYQLLHKFIDKEGRQNENVYIFESKVKIPQKQAFKRPKDRRKFRKLVKQTLRQKTDYLSIRQAIDMISAIPISSLIQGQIKVGLLKNKFSTIEKVITQIQLSNLSQEEKQSVEWIMINAEFIAALSYISWIQAKPLPSIIIQPQSFTQDMMGMSLHLHYFLKGQTSYQHHGRGKKKLTPTLTMQKLLQSFKMIFLHPTMDQHQKDLPVDDFIKGSQKLNQSHIYGYGYQAIRMWVCKNSQYLGDRKLSQTQINNELAKSLFIRKVYAEILPFLPTQISLSQLNSKERQKSFLDQFMLKMIDIFILNMQYYYQRLMLKQAYQYTIEFYKDIVDEIFVSNIRKKIIAFPNLKENLSHGLVIRRLIELLAVISPLMPFSAYQISKTSVWKWPQIKNEKCYENVLQYNKLIKIRIELQNKLFLNRFQHAEIILPQIPLSNISNRDLELFFGVDKVSLQKPLIKQKKFGFKLRNNDTIGKTKIAVFQSKDSCIRCDDQSKQSQHLCNRCIDYLQENIQKNIQFYNPTLNSLEVQQKIQKQKEFQIKTNSQKNEKLATNKQSDLNSFEKE